MSETGQWTGSSSAPGRQLWEHQSMLRLLFENSADAILLYDPQLRRFIDCNQAAIAMMRAPDKQALLSADPSDFSPELHHSGTSGNPGDDPVQQVLTNGSGRFEWNSRRHDGTQMPMDIVMTALPAGDRTLLMVVARDISAHKKAQQEILTLNASLERRVAERTVALVQANEQLKQEIAERRRQEQIERKRSAQVQKHRDILLELARMRKSDFTAALQEICRLASETLEIARVSYWSLENQDSALTCRLLYLRQSRCADEAAKGTRLTVNDCPAYFTALGDKRPLVADCACTHPATCELASSYLRPLGISSMLDAPVWVRGEVVGVLCHEHIGPTRVWSPEEIDFVSALAGMVSLAIEESQRAVSEHRLRESEKKFRALFEATSQGVMLHDENAFFSVNPAARRILGYPSEDGLIGKHPADVAVPIQPNGEDARTVAQRHIDRCLREGSAQFEWLTLTADGREVMLDVLLTAIELDGRRIIQAVVGDITERKRAEAELLKTVAREKELGQLRARFVSMVSHEFRTPLGIIHSSAEILDEYLDRLDPEERREHLQSIQKNTRRMAGMMEDLLLIGRFDAGVMDFKPAPLTVRACASRLVDEVLSTTNHRCAIELTLGRAPEVVLADERLLRHILINLLTNAVKYSSAGQKVQCELDFDRSNLSCVVRDRGIGIPAEDREWLFDAFHRGRNVGDRPGTGLGLVIVKRCVDLHGGTIDVQSTEGQGTTIAVTLPVLPAVAPTSARRETCESYE